MSKSNNQKSKKRRKSKTSAKKIRTSQISHHQPWDAPKMKMFQLPKLFPDDLSREKRLEIVREIGARAKEKFDLKFPQTLAWFREYDAIYLLSYCAFYLFSQPEGIDLEAFGELEFFHHNLEILQAFALTQERAITPKPVVGDIRRLEQEMRDVSEAMQFRLLDIPKHLTTDEELTAYYLRTQMMAQTTAIRNWAYPFQMKRVILSLADSIKDSFYSIYDLNPVDLMQLLFDLAEERNELLNAHRDKVRSFVRADTYKEIIEAYNVAYPENLAIEGDAVEEIWTLARKNKNTLVGMLVTHSDLKLDRIYSFSIEDAQRLLKVPIPHDTLKRILDQLSYQFGDLKDFNIDHIVLGNPVWNRPFIRASEETYFSAIWGIMPHIAMGVLEDLIWPHEAMRNAYTEAKADFLEDELERLFCASFPNASVFRGSLWTGHQTDKMFENDLTVVVDNFALVVEAKSGIVSDPARRGAPKRLFETLRELIEEPSEQALRFIDHLERNKKEHSFKTRRGTTNIIDSRKIKYYIPLGVTLSHLGFISSNLKKLIKAQVVSKRLEELAPSISFTDLESIFELLPLDVQKIHYLARRREFEAHVDYEGDELDLLGFYLDNGFNIGDAEYSKDMAINMSMKSKELDPYFVGSREGIEVAKPELAMTKWWKDLLYTISDRKTEGWVETGFILLNLTIEDQTEFEAKFKELMLKIGNGQVTKPHNWVAFLSGPERRRYLIAGYPYTTTQKEERNGVISEIISDENTQYMRGSVVIGVQMNRLDYPYTVLARHASTNLFDTLTLESQTE